MMEQLQMMKLRMEELKEELDHKTVVGEAAGGDIKVTATGNKKIKSIKITPELQFADPEELEEQLTVAINRAIEKAEELYQNEMKNMAGGMLPPGMF